LKAVALKLDIPAYPKELSAEEFRAAAELAEARPDLFNEDTYRRIMNAWRAKKELEDFHEYVFLGLAALRRAGEWDYAPADDDWALKDCLHECKELLAQGQEMRGWLIKAVYPLTDKREEAFLEKWIYARYAVNGFDSLRARQWYGIVTEFTQKLVTFRRNPD
jgi:hypothetical protein